MSQRTRGREMRSQKRVRLLGVWDQICNGRLEVPVMVVVRLVVTVMGGEGEGLGRLLKVEGVLAIVAGLERLKCEALASMRRLDTSYIIPIGHFVSDQRRACAKHHYW